jgi:ATP-dependent Clp protease adaptor protein ClpS
VDVGYLAMVAAGVGAYWWRHLRPLRARPKRPEAFEPDAEVALHVAAHEAGSRRQELSSLHVLYGLLQDEHIAAAIEQVGGVVATLEDRVQTAIDARTETPAEMISEAQRVVYVAAVVAEHHERRAGCTDLWAYLTNTEAATLLDASLDRHAVLFRLSHGLAEPEPVLAGGHDVHVVLRNDDYTTREFVCEILQRVFALSEADAVTKMSATHDAGYTVVGRFRATDARDKIVEVRALAKTRGYPLWIGVEPI